MKLPEKIFNIDISDVDVGLSDIHIYGKDEIEDAQAGYRYNGITGEVIEDWIGEEYFVIANDSCCGDPIIVKIDEETLPVYTMFHDDWSTLRQIAPTFDMFIDILKQIKDIDLNDKENCKTTLETIKKVLPENAWDYWETLIVSGYEFVTDKTDFTD